MKPKTKDRLMTAGTVLVICALGFTQGGCALAPQSQSQSQSQAQQQRHWNSVCTTDFDCEMHAAKGTRHSENEGWTWRKAALVVGGMLVAGYLAEKQLDNGGSSSASTSTIDVKTPGVNCVANGCAQ